ncbi:MAG: hypothetical protein Fur0032_09950 [Terrimicrobiaceae bacterium]
MKTNTVRLLCFCLFLAGVSHGLEINRRVKSSKPDPFASRSAALSMVNEDPRPFVDDPTAGGVELSGHEEPLVPYSTLTITFPSEMVGADQIDVPAVLSPLVVWPAVDTDFFWRTPSSGDLIIKGAIMAGQTYRLRLREGLTDVSGEELPVAAWGATMASSPLRVLNPRYSPRDPVGTRPQVFIELNYPVDLNTAAAGAWFQERRSRKRIPVEVFVGEGDPGQLTASNLRFRPKANLCVDLTYDFVIDGVIEPLSGRGLEFPYVEPVGRTRPLKIDYVAARNFALEKPQVVVKFDQYLADDPLPADALKFSPSVSGLKLRKEGNFVIAEGDFQIPSRYKVKVSDSILGGTGFGLAEDSVWGVTFRKMPAAVVFPDRIIRQRSATCLRFALYQAATGPLKWELAPIPMARFVEIEKRLREFDEIAEDADGHSVWGADGLLKRVPTQPLIGEFGLKPVAAGELAASSGDREELREIVWKGVGGEVPEGAMLLEVTGRDSAGRLVGNRAIVLFGEVAVTRKQSYEGSLFRVARLSDGLPVAGARVTLLDEAMKAGLSATTSDDGLVKFSKAEMADCRAVLAVVDGRPTLQPLDLADRFPGGYLQARQPASTRAFTFTDRPLYRPGQTVCFKGFVRDPGGGIPAADMPVEWQVRRNGVVTGSGRAGLSAEGGWFAEWQVPEEAELGHYELSALLNGASLPGNTWFQVEEFRVPPFSVLCEEVTPAAPAESMVKVASQYFHGAPNAGARVEWKATWYGDSEQGYYFERGEDGMCRVDLHSQSAKTPSLFAEESGEAVLDENGMVQLVSRAPFADLGNRAFSTVTWRVDVTGPDGQTLPGGAFQRVPMRGSLLGVKPEESRPGKLAFSWDVFEPFKNGVSSPVTAELFRVTSLTAKERIAPDVYRYRNSNVFTPVGKIESGAAGRMEFPVNEPGRYVVVLTPPQGSAAMPVSEEVFLEGSGDAGTPVQSDSSAEVVTIDASRVPRSTPWEVGETAELRITAPTAGVAWVSVESDQILDTFTVPLDGNLSRIQLPVKPEYEPNASVSVYLIRPGGANGLAGEMFGLTDISVESPGRTLGVEVAPAASSVRPGEEIRGTVTVRSAGRAFAGADVAVAVVDDAILELGGWRLPEGIVNRFFPYRPHGVVTYSALKAYIDTIPTDWLTAKGFTIGDGGPETTPNTTFPRKDFRPLILWVPSILTDSEGVAAFACKAPDNLTRFRVIAVVQTKDNRFGAGSGTVEVAKPLIVEPAFPRFVRAGDDIVLRAVVRSKGAPADVEVTCEASGEVSLTSESRQTVRVTPDAPAVINFPARVGAEGSAMVRLNATGAGENDAVEITIPVAEAGIRVTESVSADRLGSPLEAGVLAPASWDGREGEFHLAASSSPYLPLLLGLPAVVDYPHGCNEQKASRLLALTLLGGLLEELPEDKTRQDAYAGVISETLRDLELAMLPGGFLPYWEGGTTPQPFVTLLTAWATQSAAEAGYQVPQRLMTDSIVAARSLLENRSAETTPTLQAFALFILSRSGDPSLASAATELNLRRDRLTNDGKAWLALALLRMSTLPDAVAQLIRELPETVGDTAFDPNTFSSAARTDALVTWARLAADPTAQSDALRLRLSNLMRSSSSLSTQENLWTLLAFQALRESGKTTKLRKNLQPKAAATSGNGAAAAWGPLPLADLKEFSVRGLPKTGSAVLTGSYSLPPNAVEADSRSMRVDRIVKNLTDASRDGSPGQPFRVGDRLLISYRFSADHPQHFVALSDPLPAGVEVVNTNLALFGSLIDMPEDLPALPLSHSEMRDRVTHLYFDSFPQGSSSYAVLARATAAGSFTWPPATIAPMYDARFGARTGSGRISVNE